MNRRHFACACLFGMVVATAGCGANSSFVNPQTAMLRMTPGFLLTESAKARRDLKDPKALNLAYGRFQEGMGQQAEARKSYEGALREDFESVEAILGLARLDQLAEKPKEAEAGFQKALRLKPNDPAVLAACGQFYGSQKRWPESIQSYNAAVAAAPKDVNYKHQLAVAKTLSGDVNGGVAAFGEVVGPEKAHYNVAFLLKNEGQHALAAQHLQEAIAINPAFEPAIALMQEMQHQPGRRIDPRRQAPQLASGADEFGNANGFRPVNHQAAGNPRRATNASRATANEWPNGRQPQQRQPAY